MVATGSCRIRQYTTVAHISRSSTNAMTRTVEAPVADGPDLARVTFQRCAADLGFEGGRLAPTARKSLPAKDQGLR